MHRCFYLFVHSSLLWLHQESTKTKYVDFDVKTITAGDYSIEFDIEADIYDEFKENYFDETNPMGEI